MSAACSIRSQRIDSTFAAGVITTALPCHSSLKSSLALDMEPFRLTIRTTKRPELRNAANHPTTPRVDQPSSGRDTTGPPGVGPLTAAEGRPAGADAVAAPLSPPRC